MEVVEDAAEVPSTEASTDSKASTKKLPWIFRFHFYGSKWQLPRKVGSSAASTKAFPKAFRESFRGTFHEKLEATSIHGILDFTSMEASAASTESQRLPRQLPRIHYCASSGAYHFFDNMVDTHCVRDEGGFTVQWLVAFHWVRVRVRAKFRVGVYI